MPPGHGKFTDMAGLWDDVTTINFENPCGLSHGTPQGQGSSKPSSRRGWKRSCDSTFQWEFQDPKGRTVPYKDILWGVYPISPYRGLTKAVYIYIYII